MKEIKFVTLVRIDYESVFGRNRTIKVFLNYKDAKKYFEEEIEKAHNTLSDLYNHVEHTQEFDKEYFEIYNTLETYDSNHYYISLVSKEVE